MQSVHITTDVVSSNSAQAIQHYMIKFVSDLQHENIVTKKRSTTGIKTTFTRRIGKPNNLKVLGKGQRSKALGKGKRSKVLGKGKRSKVLGKCKRSNSFRNQYQQYTSVA